MVLEANPWFIATMLGDPRLWVSLCAILFCVRLYFRGKVGPAGKKFAWVSAFIIFAGFAMATSLGINEIVKLTFQIPRPCTIETNLYCLEGFSFPSGHTAVAFTVFMGIFYIMRNMKHVWVFIFPVLVGVSRIMLGVHTIYDVFGGAVVGMIVFLIYFFFTTKSKSIKRFVLLD